MPNVCKLRLISSGMAPLARLPADPIHNYWLLLLQGRLRSAPTIKNARTSGQLFAIAKLDC